MIGTLVAAGWAALVLVWAWAHRPPPGRLRRLTTTAGPGRCPSPGRPPPGRPGLLERLGRLVLVLVLGLVLGPRQGRGRSGRGPAGRPVEAEAARRVGAAVAAGAVALALLPVAAPPAALVAWALPGLAARRAERRRQAEMVTGLPDVVDLLVLAVGAGLTVHQAVARVAARATGPLAAELGRVVGEVALGRRLADALDDLPRRAGEAVRPLVAALVASERYGAPLVAGLERLAGEVRRDRRRRAEEAAHKVPVKLLFPLVTCTLPAFGLLTVAPLVASAVRSLRI